MSIAQKLTTVAENAPKVYEAGKETGKQAERKRFWDCYFEAGTVGYGGISFFGAGWNDDTFYPNHDIVLQGDRSSAFRYCRITDLEGRLAECGVTLDTSGATNLNCAFSESRLTHLPTIDMTSITTSSGAHGIFAGAPAVTIRKLIVTEKVPFSSCFQNMRMLENLVIEGTIGQNGFNVQWSTKLTHDSLMSIVEALQDYSATGATGTVTLGADNLAKLSDGEKAIATQKGWTLV